MRKGSKINRLRIMKAVLAACLAGVVLLQCVSCHCAFDFGQGQKEENEIVYANRWSFSAVTISALPL